PAGRLAAIGHAHGARLAVQLEEHGARAVLVRLAARDVAHDESLAALEIDADLLPGLRAVEEHRGGQNPRIAVESPLLRVLEPHARVHEIRGELVVRALARPSPLERRPLGSEV